QLSQDEGVNRAGIRRIMELEDQVEALRARVEEMAAELDAARTALAAGRRHAGAAASGGIVDSAVVASPCDSGGGAGAVPGDAVVPWRSRATAIVTWQPRR